MKFIISFVILIIASIVALSSTKAVNYVDKSREQFYLKLTDECRQEVSESELFKKCHFYDFDMNKLKDVCEDILSNECKHFYSDELKYIPKCINDPVMKKVAEYSKETSIDASDYYYIIINDGKTMSISC